MRLGRNIRSLRVHVPPSLTATCQPIPVSLKVERTIYIGSIADTHLGQIMRVFEKVRIPTLPPLIFIKALIFQGFFVPMCFWSPIWSPIISLAFAGLQRIVMEVLFSWCLMIHARTGRFFEGSGEGRYAWVLPAAIDPAPDHRGRFATPSLTRAAPNGGGGAL